MRHANSRSPLWLDLAAALKMNYAYGVEFIQHAIPFQLEKCGNVGRNFYTEGDLTKVLLRDRTFSERGQWDRA